MEGGFKVGKSDGTKMKTGRMYASNKPLAKDKAQKQLEALYANEK